MIQRDKFHVCPKCAFFHNQKNILYIHLRTHRRLSFRSRPITRQSRCRTCGQIVKNGNTNFHKKIHRTGSLKQGGVCPKKFTGIVRRLKKQRFTYKDLDQPYLTKTIKATCMLKGFLFEIQQLSVIKACKTRILFRKQYTPFRQGYVGNCAFISIWNSLSKQTSNNFGRSCFVYWNIDIDLYVVRFYGRGSIQKQLVAINGQIVLFKDPKIIFLMGTQLHPVQIGPYLIQKAFAKFMGGYNRMQNLKIDSVCLSLCGIAPRIVSYEDLAKDSYHFALGQTQDEAQDFVPNHTYLIQGRKCLPFWQERQDVLTKENHNQFAYFFKVFFKGITYYRLDISKKKRLYIKKHKSHIFYIVGSAEKKLPQRKNMGNISGTIMEVNQRGKTLTQIKKKQYFQIFESGQSQNYLFIFDFDNLTTLKVYSNGVLSIYKAK